MKGATLGTGRSPRGRSPSLSRAGRSPAAGGFPRKGCQRAICGDEGVESHRQLLDQLRELDM